MTAERDRLAALLPNPLDDDFWEEVEDGEKVDVRFRAATYADRLIAAGWTDLPVERLARALHTVDDEVQFMHRDAFHHRDVIAGRIAAAYREDAK